MKKIIIATLVLTLICLAAAGCAPKTEESKKVTISTKAYTEGYIIGEMLALIVENNTDIKVERAFDLSSDYPIIWAALLKGDVDMYPEYTSTAWYYILKEEEIVSHEEQYKKLQEIFEKEYGLKWLGLYGFNNSYALCVRKDTAQEYNLTKNSDLTAVAPELVFGANFSYFEREDGFNALAEYYDLQFADTVELGLGLRYQALDDKQIDVVNAFTTDGLVKKYDLVCLQDDKQFFKEYYCGTVIRKDTLKEYPELEDALSKMNDLISTEQMTELNYLVDLQGKNYEDVAKDFLKEKGLI